MTIENLAKAVTISKELKMCDYIIEHGNNEADVLNLEFVNSQLPRT